MTRSGWLLLPRPSLGVHRVADRATARGFVQFLEHARVFWASGLLPTLVLLRGCLPPLCSRLALSHGLAPCLESPAPNSIPSLPYAQQFSISFRDSLGLHFWSLDNIWLNLQ